MGPWTCPSILVRSAVEFRWCDRDPRAARRQNLLAAYSSPGTPPGSFNVFRLDPNGLLDSAFKIGTVLPTRRARAGQLDGFAGHGKVLIAGDFSTVDGLAATASLG
jgi:hypothetical protein